MILAGNDRDDFIEKHFPPVMIPILKDMKTFESIRDYLLITLGITVTGEMNCARLLEKH